MSTEQNATSRGTVIALKGKRGKRRESGPDQTSDAALARAFIEAHGDVVRYDPIADHWYHFDGTLWRPDRTDKIAALVLETISARGIGSARKVRDAKRLAQLEPGIIATSEAWNADPHTLGTPNGVVDLRAGELLPRSPAHMVSLSTAVSPQREPAHTWLSFISDATRGDAEYARYLQRLTGYWLTGLVNIEGFWFLYGDGGGGKGTFIDTFAACLGDYGWKAAARTLLASESDRHLSELVPFQSRRMVYISETPPGRHWDMARLKELTGGDPINANRMRQDPIIFNPTHKLIAMGNHAPSVPVIDNSVLRRFHVLPFDNIVPNDKRDITLKLRLRGELPQILAWAIEGAREVIAGGLPTPAIVAKASADYFSTEDGFRDWLDEKCYRGEGHKETAGTLLRSWNAFRKDRGEAPETAKTFAERMTRGGFARVKSSQIWWHGLTLNNGGAS